MPKALWLLVIGMAVNVTGSSFLWPLNTIYIHEHLGKSLSVAGVVLMLNSAASVVGNLIGGTLFDKIGGYRSILFGIFITVLSLGGLTLWHDWIPYVIFLTVAGFGSGIVFPSMYAMAGSVWKEGGRKAFNAIYIAQNLGVALGAALGGVIASISFQLIFLANTLMYIIFLVIAVYGYRGIQTAQPKQTNILQENGPVRNYAKLYAMVTISAGYLLCWVAYVQWQAVIPAYARELGVTVGQYSVLWTVNGALIVLGQPIVNRLVRPFEKSLKIQMMIGILIFIGSFFITASAGEFTGFLGAMVVLTIGEMLIWPAVPTVANELAPKGREGFYQGIVNSTATAGRMVGPLLGGIVADVYGMSILFSVLVFLLAGAILTTAVHDRKLKQAASLQEKAL
ncbi:MDR family MFS transporter [Mesobacillus zeae]|uniref:MFS transporter n=1 Tax=Mesobacillus zeae TaxID=1917180 RepID=A0A398AZP3_9BACI|nr:MFS transporter [Mesobacillus zeae]RID83067.1 MFS transporter [Mesobacillus zeae]